MAPASRWFTATTQSAGWQMRPSDQFFVGDFNGDKKADLFVFNGRAWSIPYLGMLASGGSRALHGDTL